jgi:hypothetical protein
VTERTALALLHVVDVIDPENNASLQPRSGLTFCNDAITELTMGLGCPVPIALANAQHDWLAGSAGLAEGWMPVDSETARQRAELGYPVVASWKNGTGGHGHIALVVPAPAKDPGHIYVAAAGSKNYNRTRIENSFGLEIHPDFFTCQ